MSQYFSTQTALNISVGDIFQALPFQFSLSFLQDIYPNKAPTKKEQQWLEQLTRHLLRTITSLILTPEMNGNSEKELQYYLNNWLRPLLHFSK
jgi:hypothetical protein